MNRKIRNLFKGKRRFDGNLPNCLVYEDKTRKRRLEYIVPGNIPEGAFPRDYNGYSVHVLNRDSDDKLTPITYPNEIVENETPVDLYLALNCEAEVNEAYHMDESIWDKIPYVFFYVLIFIEIFLVFIIGMSSAGG